MSNPFGAVRDHRLYAVMLVAGVVTTCVVCMMRMNISQEFIRRIPSIQHQIHSG